MSTHPGIRVLVPRHAGLVAILLLIPAGATAQDLLSLGPDGVRFREVVPKSIAAEWGGARVRTWDSGTVRSDPDVRLLHQIYSWDSPFAHGYLGAVDATAYPVMLAAPVSAVLFASVSDRINRVDVVFVASTWGSTVAAMLILKGVVKRPRPFTIHRDLPARAGYRGTRNLAEHASMPSGHAMLAAAVATSASLLAPRWYVVVPGAVWAGSVSVSRVWLGVHYPSDVLVGSVLGAALAAGAHLIIY